MALLTLTATQLQAGDRWTPITGTVVTIESIETSPLIELFIPWKKNWIGVAVSMSPTIITGMWSRSGQAFRGRWSVQPDVPLSIERL